MASGCSSTCRHQDARASRIAGALTVRSQGKVADEEAFILDNRMTGYGAEATPERPADDACERRIVAGLTEAAVYLALDRTAVQGGLRAVRDLRP